MKIGDLAKIVGISVETIRFYEQKGLIPLPPRTSGNFRNYTDEHVERLTMIRHCRALDMSHDEIQILLECVDHPDDTCLKVNVVLDDHISHVAERIADLQALEKRLTTLRNRCSAPALVEDCGILRGLAEPDQPELRAEVSHVRQAHL